MRSRRLGGAVLVAVGAVVLAVVEPAVGASASHVPRQRIEPGTAAATASVLGISPAVSGLQLSATIGESSAAFQHTETQAKSATLDLGSLGLVLATSQFCGRSLLPSKSQPQPLTADSQDGEQHRTYGTKGLGAESVAVDPSPESATATTTTIDQKLPGVVSVRGRSRAAVRYLDGRRQVATSSVTEDVTLLGGVVRLEGMRWTASRTSGTSTTRKTDFSFGRVFIGGVPLEAPDRAPGATIDAINKALAAAGLSVIQPVRSTNQHTGAVAIGPFTLRFSGSRIERTLFKPVVDGVVTLENLVKSLGSPGDNCAQFRELMYNLGNNSGTLVHVVLAIAQGAGALDLQFGGVAAGALNPETFANPFDAGHLPSPSHQPPGELGSPGSRGRHPVGVSASDTSATGGGAPGAIPPTVAAAAEHCISTSPSRAHGCWHGLATVASTGALAVGVGLLVTDVAITRRRRNTTLHLNPRSAEASE
ncbi:MAG TPA: hypothetical protein VHA79_13025 [Mycobacteriales bacterium]|nr:hypothetical protein [Mycobacteriales bacterium]